MKIWFEKSYSSEEDPKIGIDWFKHSDRHPYKGFTVHLYFFHWWFMLNWVNDYQKYKCAMEFRTYRLKPEELKIDIFRPPGAGVNDHSTGVRVTHVPTGEFAISVKSKTIAMNRMKAMSELRRRVIEKCLEKKKK